jgi:putative Holliday junction resolvase
VDPGEARIGLALSDPLQTIAAPLFVLRHTSRKSDAETIVRLAREHDVEAIIVGVAYDQEGEVGPQARRALRLADALREFASVPVLTCDESGTTVAALQSGGQRNELDARAAAAILQEYLNSRHG